MDIASTRGAIRAAATLTIVLTLGPLFPLAVSGQTSDSAEQKGVAEQIQDLVAADLSTLPLLQGKQVAVVGADVQGTTLDGSFKFRYAPMHK